MNPIVKNWYLLIAIFLFIGCNHDEKEVEYSKITIEKHYPYLYEKHSIEDIDINTDELFRQKIYLINSMTQLNENPLSIYSPDVLKEELSQCNFNRYTLIITSSASLNEVVDLKSYFYYNNYYSEYEYSQAFSIKLRDEPIKNIYYIINAFSIKKIPEESKLIFSKAMNAS